MKKSLRIINLFPPVSNILQLHQYFAAAAENRCRGACVKHLTTWAFAAANAPTIISRLVFFANGPGAADVFLNGPRVAGVLHLAGASDDHFQRLATAISASPAPVVEISAVLVCSELAANSLAPVISARSSSMFPSSETWLAPLASNANRGPVNCFATSLPHR